MNAVPVLSIDNLILCIMFLAAHGLDRWVAWLSNQPKNSSNMVCNI